MVEDHRRMNYSNTIPASALTVETPFQYHGFLRLRRVLDTRGIEKSQQYLDIKNGLFTPPIKLGAQAVGWPGREVAALNAARVAGKSNEQIRALVQQLIAFRLTLA